MFVMGKSFPQSIVVDLARLPIEAPAEGDG
jgi:hypothetical protein